MKIAVTVLLAGLILFSTPAAYAGRTTVQDCAGRQNLPASPLSPPIAAPPDLPDYTKLPYFLIVDGAVFPSRIHQEWPPLPWTIFITNEPKNNFIAVYYDEAVVRYAEWSTDTENGAVIRGYHCVNGTFVFDKEIPRSAGKK